MSDNKEIDIENLPQAPDMETVEEKGSPSPLSTELPQAPDMEAIEAKPLLPPLSTELPQAPDIESLTEEIKTRISAEIPLSADKEIVVEQPIVRIPLEFPQTANIELKKAFIPFDGEWMPDSDPIEIGAKNYKTLQNYRYAGDKIIHLEGVLGYTKITTNVLPTNYRDIRNGYQLRTEYATTSYNLAHSAYASNNGKIFTNITAPPTAGDWVGTSNATVLHEDAAADLEGRFSDAPGGQLAYCNGKESCIWAGDEMRCAGFFTFEIPTITGSTDISFVDGGGSADTITDGGSGFVVAGFKAGHTITVSGTTNNNGEYLIVTVAAAIITLITGVLTAEANQSATITVSVKKDHINTKDLTEAVNNEINSAAEAATIIGVATTAGFRSLVLSTRPLQGVKLYIRTVNGTGSATTTFKVWDGDSFEAVNTPSDGTDDTNGSMKQTGTFSWNYSATTTAKPLHFEGLYLYAYLFELSAGSGVIYNVTVDAPFQAIVDVWDGVYRQPIQCQVGRGLALSGTISGSANLIANVSSFYPGQVLIPDADWADIQIGAEITANALTHTVIAKYGPWVTGSWVGVNAYVHNTWYNGGTGYSYTYSNPADSGSADYKDFTLEVNEPSFADYPIGAVIDGLTSANSIVVGFEERMSAIWFGMIADLVNTNSVKMSIGYWNGETYVNQLGQSDSTYGLPGGNGVNKSFNRTGLVSWDAPDEEDEFRQTLFGVNAYYYQINVDGTLSGTEGGAAEVVIDTIKGIPAQNVVNPFKFSVQYKNRLMLCGFTEGKEGNRIDYSVKDAPDVFNGEESSMDGIQSLYVGGRDDLTGAIEIFNRFGSNIISCLLLFKANETYLLTGDGPDNYRLYTISKTIGCPAPLTLAAAETGYTFAEEINRNIVMWMAYAGVMIFDGAAIVPVPGIKTYFDPAKTARLETDLIERCRGWHDNTYKEYNLVIPSATGATDCNVWLFYDLVRKRWSEKEPGASEIPQAAWPVYDTDGVQYIYAGTDDGHIMRLEHGPKWADDSDTDMTCIIETGDFFPSGDIWDITSIRRVKTAIKKISESAKNLAITWYKDTEASGTSLTAHDLDAGDVITKFTQAAPSATPLRGWTHRFLFSVTTVTTSQLRPIGFGYQYFVERDDERDV